MNISTIDTTLRSNSTMSVSERDMLVLEMLDEVQGMVRNFSYKYHMDYDDCYQHASLLMLEAWQKRDAAKNSRAYLNATVRRGLYALLDSYSKQDMSEMSLDRVYDDDEETRLLDKLEAPSVSEAEKAQAEAYEKIVHAALRECRIEEQEYACRVFELNGYTPVAPVKTRVAYGGVKSDKPRLTENMRKSIKRVFHKHPQVLSLIQREPCVL